MPSRALHDRGRGSGLDAGRRSVSIGAHRRRGPGSIALRSSPRMARWLGTVSSIAMPCPSSRIMPRGRVTHGRHASYRPEHPPQRIRSDDELCVAVKGGPRGVTRVSMCRSSGSFTDRSCPQCGRARRGRIARGGIADCVVTRPAPGTRPIVGSKTSRARSLRESRAARRSGGTAGELGGARRFASRIVRAARLTGTVTTGL